MSTRIWGTQPAMAEQDRRKLALDGRLAGLFWALLFILTGTLLMFPDERIPHGSWLVGIGLILLTLNAVRLATGIPVRVLPTLLGALALAAGLGAYAGVTLPLFALTLVAIGASIVLEPLWAHRA
jgi:hypothetical protein